MRHLLRIKSTSECLLDIDKALNDWKVFFYFCHRFQFGFRVVKATVDLTVPRFVRTMTWNSAGFGDIRRFFYVRQNNNEKTKFVENLSNMQCQETLFFIFLVLCGKKINKNKLLSFRFRFWKSANSCEQIRSEDCCSDTSEFPMFFFYF